MTQVAVSMPVAPAVPIPPPTENAKLDEVVRRVKEGAAKFARLAIDERIALCEQFRQGYRAIAEESVLAACRAKGIDPTSPLAGEEWLGGPMVTIRNLRLTAQALREVKQYGAPKIEREWTHTLPDGRLAIKVFPTNGIDAFLLAKQTAEVHMQPGVTFENLREHQASFYRKPHGGRLCVVLGAGNVNSIPPTDVAYKMFVEGSACVLKMNPVNAYIGPFIERAFAPAIAAGYFAVVYGGAAEGSYLVNHPLTDEIHITGSDKTHDAMVWGTGADGDSRKKRNEPLLKKDISSELGNITPVIVVPGPYSTGELEYQGANIAGMVANNASFNCNSAKLLVTPREWDGRSKVIDAVAKGLGRGAPRKAYYPGAEQRWKQFIEGRPNVKLVGSAGDGQLPWAIIPDVDPAKADDRVFTQEPWCAVLSETAVSGADVPKYLDGAVRFVNEKVWGTLAAMVIVHPKTMKDPVAGPAVEKAIRELRYGAVCVNTWAGAVFGLGQTPWGAHPSSTLADIQSGRGWVHNTYMLEEIEKCVLRAPVKAFPINPWFPGHRTAHKLGQRLMDLEMDPGWGKVVPVALAAMRG